MNLRGVQAERPRDHGFGSGTVLVALLFVAATAGVAWVYLGMVAHDRWPIRWLQVDGVFERVSAEQVRSSAAPLVNGSFFTVDLAAVRAAVQRKAWVSDVVVQKTWPDTVRVVVFEYTPVAHWTGGRLVSAQGRAFSVPGADEMQGLPWLEGPEGALETVVDNWQRFNNELLPTGLEIDRLRLDRRGAWYLVLSSGTQVNIGREDATGRLRRMVSGWPELLKKHERMPSTVDLRYTNGFAVQWPEPPPSLAANGG